MSKEEILGFKPAPRLELILPHDANLGPDGIFGKDSQLWSIKILQFVLI
jgi:hypothetical protein